LASFDGGPSSRRAGLYEKAISIAKSDHQKPRRTAFLLRDHAKSRNQKKLKAAARFQKHLTACYVMQPKHCNATSIK